VSRCGGGGGTGPRLGVGGATGFLSCIRSPMKGGGTPNLEPDSPGSYDSSTGVFGGLGGGGGPGFEIEPAWTLEALGGLVTWASLPASANGGGAANLGGGGPRGGEGSRGGVGSRAGSFTTDLLAGGGAGGAPLPRPACVG
jgi:hypothetical protein